jgi:hypothetical protein
MCSTLPDFDATINKQLHFHSPQKLLTSPWGAGDINSSLPLKVCYGDNHPRQKLELQFIEKDQETDKWNEIGAASKKRQGQL